MIEKATPDGEGSWLAALDSVSLRSNFEFTLFPNFKRFARAVCLRTGVLIKTQPATACWVCVCAEIGVARLRLASVLDSLRNECDALPRPMQVALKRPAKWEPKLW